jgi:hypothetical protein
VKTPCSPNGIEVVLFLRLVVWLLCERVRAGQPT